MAIPTTLTRSTVTILVPGTVALSPWLLLLVQHTSATLGFKYYATLANAMVLAAVIVTGSVCEGLSTFIERHWDRKREAELDITKNWLDYLSSTFDKEPVGFRYLSRLVTTMYFELSMLIATPVFLAGSGVLAYLRFPHNGCLVVIAAAVTAIASALFFWWQAGQTHRVICQTRREVLRRAS